MYAYIVGGFQRLSMLLPDTTIRIMTFAGALVVSQTPIGVPDARLITALVAGLRQWRTPTRPNPTE